MTKLSDPQSIILSAAAQRADGNVLPLPGSLRGGAATKVVVALLRRDLIREHVVDSPRRAAPALNRIWRNLDDGRGVLLFITAAGADAIGVEPDSEPGTGVGYRFDAGANSAGEPAAGAPTSADEAPSAPATADTPPEAPAPATGGLPRAGSRLALLIDLLRRPDGVTVDEMTAATGWQPHSVRGALAGALKKKFGLEIGSTKAKGEARRYCITR